VPPAGLEPAALCLASSIRLSLTARQSWGCWLDYILDVSVPTRIVSEDPSQIRFEVSCGLPNPRGFLLRLDRGAVPEALRASPHTGSSTQWVPRRVPHQGSNKADALSAELQGHQFNGSAHVNARNWSGQPELSLTKKGRARSKTNKKRSPFWGRSLLERS